MKKLKNQNNHASPKTTVPECRIVTPPSNLTSISTSLPSAFFYYLILSFSFVLFLCLTYWSSPLHTFTTFLVLLLYTSRSTGLSKSGGIRQSLLNILRVHSQDNYWSWRLYSASPQYIPLAMRFISWQSSSYGTLCSALKVRSINDWYQESTGSLKDFNSPFNQHCTAFESSLRHFAFRLSP